AQRTSTVSLPYAHRAILATRGQPHVGLTERNRIDGTTVGRWQRQNPFPGNVVPEPDGGILTTCSKHRPLRGEGNGVHASRVDQWTGNNLAETRIPQADAAIMPGRGQHISYWSEGQRPHAALRSDRPNPASCRHIPNLDGAVSAATAR